jgi:hypothetical protein
MKIKDDLLAGKRVTITTLKGAKVIDKEIHKYNNEGYLIETKLSSGIIKCNYDTNNNLISMDGLVIREFKHKQLGESIIQEGYNEYNKLIEINVFNNDKILCSIGENYIFHYKYEKDKLITIEQTTINSSTTAIHNFEYDKLGRLSYDEIKSPDGSLEEWNVYKYNGDSELISKAISTDRYNRILDNIYEYSSITDEDK